MRSNPAPVSIPGLGSGTSSPEGWRSSVWKTRFHNSTYRSSPPPTGPPPIPHSGPRSKWISEHGPQGPVSPISQKLSSSVCWIRDRGTPTTSAHRSAASSSVV